MLDIVQDDRSPEDILEAHPLLQWIAWMRKLGSEWAVEPNNREPRDLLLSPSCSARFCLSMEDEDVLAMTAQAEDLRALLSVTWEMAAFRRGVKGRDYIILSCPDVGEAVVDARPDANRVKLRLFVNLSAEMGESLAAVDPAPTKLHLRPMVRHRLALLRSVGPPKAVVQLDYPPT